MRDIEPKETVFSISGVQIASHYSRVVHGGRGPYVEFYWEHLNEALLEIQPGQEYRLKGDWPTKVFYAWYRTKDSHKKVYFQFKRVDYADYLVGMVYISPSDLDYAGELYTEKSNFSLGDE